VPHLGAARQLAPDSGHHVVRGHPRRLSVEEDARALGHLTT
jgi:hypothetical protein